MSPPQNNIEDLRSRILKAKHAYYYSGEPIMNHAEYAGRPVAPDFA